MSRKPHASSCERKGAHPVLLGWANVLPSGQLRSACSFQL